MGHRARTIRPAQQHESFIAPSHRIPQVQPTRVEKVQFLSSGNVLLGGMMTPPRGQCAVNGQHTSIPIVLRDCRPHGDEEDGGHAANEKTGIPQGSGLGRVGSKGRT